MGSRIGAASRIPVKTTTKAASNSTTRKNDGWRSAVVMVSPMPDLSSTGLPEASLMTLSLSVCAWLHCQTRWTVFSTFRLRRLAHSDGADGAGGDVEAT